MIYLPIGENFLLYVNHRRALISDNSLDFSVIKCEIKIKSSYPILKNAYIWLLRQQQAYFQMANQVDCYRTREIHRKPNTIWAY